MGRARVTEVRCKSALNRVEGMPFRWSLNPYRGCSHACSYCYARTTHAFLGLDAGDDFSTQLFAKVNIAGVLREEMQRRSWGHETVALGTATDPYQAIEGRYRLTRSCLEVLAASGTPATVTTKGTLVVRDVDVLQTLAGQAGARVNFSLITLDEQVWRTLEPGTPPPRQRLAALERLARAGVPCGLALAPILPGLTDAPAALAAVVQAAAQRGAQWVWSGTLHLEPAVRDHLLTVITAQYPQQANRYAQVFGAVGTAARARYVSTLYGERVGRQVAELRERYGLVDRPARPEGATRPRPSRAAQLALPL